MHDNNDLTSTPKVVALTAAIEQSIRSRRDSGRAEIIIVTDTEVLRIPRATKKVFVTKSGYQPVYTFKSP